jgi:hypothetical protein
VKDELQQLPAVGPSIAADLRRLGVKSIRDLARRDPERLYARLCEVTGQRQDPCVLYTFRCAVYAARTEKPDPELLKWWNWVNAGSKTADLLSAAPRERRHTEVPAGPKVKRRSLRGRTLDRA